MSNVQSKKKNTTLSTKPPSIQMDFMTKKCWLCGCLYVGPQECPNVCDMCNKRTGILVRPNEVHKVNSNGCLMINPWTVIPDSIAFDRRGNMRTSERGVPIFYDIDTVNKT